MRFKQLLFPALLVCMYSCNSKRGDTYAIKDFRKSIEPFLVKIATEGLVTYHDSAQTNRITDEELKRLGQSENPVLRATAYQEMLDRDSFNDLELVMNHLGDTAIVPVDHGEFGIWFQTVSDYIIQQTTWETLADKNKTIEQVLTKHNYLRSAYIILSLLEPQEKYYPYIRDMAIRPRRLDPYEGYELGFDDIEYALYGLAKFRKKEDIPIIKNKLLQHVWKLSDVSFGLLKEFPDTAFFDVLQDYHRRQFYEFSGNRPHGFTGIAADRAAPEDFIEALVLQQSNRSAKLLDSMLTYLPQLTCMPDKESIIREVIEQVWKHPCPAYIPLREKIRPRVQKILARQVTIHMDTYPVQLDTTKRKFRWWM
jgi:hypothetical protein